MMRKDCYALLGLICKKMFVLGKIMKEIVLIFLLPFLLLTLIYIHYLFFLTTQGVHVC